MNPVRQAHFHADQQRPLEEPVDAERATVIQEEFARRPPSPEDEYFLARDLRRGRSLSLAEPIPLTQVTRSEPTDDTPAATAPVPRWRKVYRAISRWLENATPIP